MALSINNINNQSTSPDNIKLIINHLLSDQSKQISKSYTTPIFKFEFYVFDLIIPLEIFKKMTHPILTFRLFDYPSQSIIGIKEEKTKVISFRTGKSCIFEMDTEVLKKKLLNEPLYVMLIDSFSSELRIIASSKLNISIFSYNQFMEDANDKTLPRRNILKLYDNMHEPICEFDLTLLLKRESFPYSNKVIHALTENKEEDKDSNDGVVRNENKKDKKDEKEGIKEDVVCSCRCKKNEKKKGKEKQNKYNYTVNIRNEKNDHLKENLSQIEREIHIVNKEKKEIYDIHSIHDRNNKFPPPLFYNSKSETYTKHKHSINKQAESYDRAHKNSKETKINYTNLKHIKPIHENDFTIGDKTDKISQISKIIKIESNSRKESQKKASPSINSLKYLIESDVPLKKYSEKNENVDSNEHNESVHHYIDNEYNKFDEVGCMNTIQSNSNFYKKEYSSVEVEIEEDFN